MRKFAITLGYANPVTINESIRKYYEFATEKDVTHIILNNHYPLPTPEAASENLRRLCQEYGIHLLDAGENLGLHRGFNYVLDAIGWPQGSAVIGYDPDTCPETKGWDSALFKAIEDDSTVVWASLFNSISKREMIDRTFKIDGRLWVPNSPVINSICAWRMDWLKDVGGLTEGNKYYGGLECAMWNNLDQKTKRWVFLQDFHEVRMAGLETSVDAAYTAYKWEHAHEGYPGSFDDFLHDRWQK